MRRLLAAKVKVDLDLSHHIDLKKIADVVNLPENAVRAEAIAAHAVTLVRNDGDLHPAALAGAMQTEGVCFVAMVESHNGKEGDVPSAINFTRSRPAAPFFSIAPDEAKTSSPGLLAVPCDLYVVAAWVSVAGYRGNVALQRRFARAAE